MGRRRQLLADQISVGMLRRDRGHFCRGTRHERNPHLHATLQCCTYHCTIAHLRRGRGKGVVSKNKKNIQSEDKISCLTFSFQTENPFLLHNCIFAFREACLRKESLKTLRVTINSTSTNSAAAVMLLV